MLTLPAIITLGVALSTRQAQDTVRVRADGAPVWGKDVRLVEELAIGKADGPPEYAFGRIYQAAPAGDGSFYLYDVNDGQIRRYDPQGRFTGLIGRRGGGPGEYQTVGGMMVDSSGLLVVFDPGSRRITHFGPDGKLRREMRTTRGSFDSFVMDRAGRMYFIVTAGGQLMEGPGAKQQFLRLSPEGRVIDSLPWPRLTDDSPVRTTFALSTSDGMRLSFSTANIVRPYLGGGMLAAASGAYRVIVSDGRRATVIERAQTPVKLGGEERAQWIEWADSMRLRGGGPYEIPREKPLIRDLRSDHQGRIWVDVYVDAERRKNLPATRANGGKQILWWRERTTYDVFSPQGQYLGRVALPEQSVLLAISGNRLFTRGMGPDDEERIVVLRLDVPDRR